MRFNPSMRPNKKPKRVPKRDSLRSKAQMDIVAESKIAELPLALVCAQPRPKRQNPNFVNAGKPHRFKKGASANPLGRPKGTSMSNVLKTYLDQAVIEVPHLLRLANKYGILVEGLLVKDMLAQIMIARSMSGDTMLVKEILDRTEGKVTEKHQHEISPKLYDQSAPIEEV